MAFIKHGVPNIGDWVTTKKIHSNCAGYFDVGTEVQIIGIGIRGYDIEDCEGNIVREIGWEI
jgi:hypothetical protein